MDDTIDLSLVPTDELLAEVEKRFDAAIFVGDAIAKLGDKTETIFRWYGSLNHAIGLASRSHDRFLRISHRREKPGDDPAPE